MIVTEQNKELIKAFMGIMIDLNVSKDATCMMVTALKSVEQMTELVEWMKKQPQETLMEREIVEKALEISKSTPKMQKETLPMVQSEFTPMQEALIEVLACMPLSEEDKVLIVMLLPKDEQIYELLVWLKKEVTENQIKIKEQEIIAKALEISKAK